LIFTSYFSIYKLIYAPILSIYKLIIWQMEPDNTNKTDLQGFSFTQTRNFLNGFAEFVVVYFYTVVKVNFYFI